MILTSFPNLTGLVVNLKFLRQTEFNLMHEMAVDAFLRHTLNVGEEYTKHFSILTPENGRLHYQEGDPYRFVVLAQGSDDDLKPIWQSLIDKLRALPDSAPIKDQNVPLKDNIKLIGLQDLFDGIPVSDVTSLDAYTEHRAAEQAQSWFKEAQLQTESTEIHWTWQSIVRLLKEEHKYLKNELRFCRDKNDLTPHLLLKRLYETLVNISANFGHKLNPELSQIHQAWLEQQAEFIQITQADLYWVDTPYFGKQKKQNTLGGMAGSFTLKLNPGIEPGVLGLFILAQVVGFGQRRTSGFGKYRLKHNFKKQHLSLGLQPYQVTRAQSLLEHLTQDHLIARAIQQTEQKPNIDELSEKTHAQIQSALGQIRRHHYQTPPMQGFTIPKKDGDDRLLAVSPLFDRIIQKSAALALTPGLDALMAQGSYGYRKGLSRQQVRYEVQNAYRQGYKWVYESDIEDFFDSVNRKQLMNRLQALFGKDPLWKLLNDWLGQNIHFKDTIIERKNHHQGLPQGSPLSPLLANFILDDFDSDLELHGFKMIRFADDFIILCKNKHQAELAALGVKYSLAQVQLKINIEKTHIVELSEGFRFLGYLFRDDHAIELAGEKSDGRTSFSAEDIPKNLPAWLANMGDRYPKDLDDDDLPKKEHGQLEEQGMHLILAGDAQILTTDNHHLVVKKEDKITHKVSWEQLHAITLIGLHHMTLPAQHQALANRIPVHMADRVGTYLGALTSFKPAQSNYRNWFIQLQMSDSQDFALYFAKKLVISRIHNQKQTLFKRKEQRKQLQQTLAKLKQLQHKVNQAEKLTNLNGFEGAATKAYFSQLNLFLPKWAQFKKRTRRPPKDPFNVLLSLGYTILYSHVDSVLQSAGFMTWKGLYHQQTAGHSALASDIMESYRHIVERFAIYVINHGQIKEEDFREEQDLHGKNTLRLSAEARRRYVSGLVNRFQKFSQKNTLHQHLYQQAQNLKQAMQSQTLANYEPWKELK
jgi:group II intron reverse transcriptase/maturase/CRISPR-associated endonuclease Cas1